MTLPRLYDYWRSSASYRVRIALNLKGIAYEASAIDLRRGEQRSAAHLARHPQGLVPMLEIDGQRLLQSLPIIEYLDECHPDPPLLSAEPAARARLRALAQLVACDIHPLNNLRVLRYLEAQLELDAAATEERRESIRRSRGPLPTYDFGQPEWARESLPEAAD